MPICSNLTYSAASTRLKIVGPSNSMFGGYSTMAQIFYGGTRYVAIAAPYDNSGAGSVFIGQVPNILAQTGTLNLSTLPSYFLKLKGATGDTLGSSGTIMSAVINGVTRIQIPATGNNALYSLRFPELIANLGSTIDLTVVPSYGTKFLGTSGGRLGYYGTTLKFNLGAIDYLMVPSSHLFSGKSCFFLIQCTSVDSLGGQTVNLDPIPSFVLKVTEASNENGLLGYGVSMQITQSNVQYLLVSSPSLESNPGAAFIFRLTDLVANLGTNLVLNTLPNYVVKLLPSLAGCTICPRLSYGYIVVSTFLNSQYLIISAPETASGGRVFFCNFQTILTKLGLVADLSSFCTMLSGGDRLGSSAIVPFNAESVAIATGVCTGCSGAVYIANGTAVVSQGNIAIDIRYGSAPYVTQIGGSAANGFYDQLGAGRMAVTTTTTGVQHLIMPAPGYNNAAGSFYFAKVQSFIPGAGGSTSGTPGAMYSLSTGLQDKLWPNITRIAGENPVDFFGSAGGNYWLPDSGMLPLTDTNNKTDFVLIAAHQPNGPTGLVYVVAPLCDYP